MQGMSEMAKNAQFEFSDASHNCLLKKLYHQHQTSQNLDLKLKVSGEEINMHGFLFAAESDSYKDLLPRRHFSPDNMCIELSRVCNDYSHLESTIRYIYTREICLDENNVEGILKICRFFSFSRLINHIKQFLLNRMNPLTCFKIWKIARKHRIPDIEKMAYILLQNLSWNQNLKDFIDYIEYMVVSHDFGLTPISTNEPLPIRNFMSWLERNPIERPLLTEREFCCDHQYFNSLRRRYNRSINEIEAYDSKKSHTTLAYKDWIVTLKENDRIAIYFPEESIWLQLFDCLTGIVIGATREEIVVLNELEGVLIMWNMKNWSRTFVAFPERGKAIFSKYFCSRSHLHCVTCKWLGVNMRVEIMTYEGYWQISECKIYRNWAGIYCQLKIDNSSYLSNCYYILLSVWVSGEIFDQTADKFCILAYDITSRRLTRVFESNFWYSSENHVLNKGNVSYIVKENKQISIVDQLKSGFLTATLLSTGTPVNLPVPKLELLRPENVTLSNVNPTFLRRYKGISLFRTFSSNLFLIESTAPFISRIFTFDILDGKKWIELPPSPLPNVGMTTLDVFARYPESNSQCNYHIVNEKHIPFQCHPFINMRIDDWKGTMEVIDLDENDYL